MLNKWSDRNYYFQSLTFYIQTATEKVWFPFYQAQLYLLGYSFNRAVLNKHLKIYIYHIYDPSRNIYKLMKVICKTSFPWLLIKLPPRVLATSLKTN